MNAIFRKDGSPRQGHCERPSSEHSPNWRFSCLRLADLLNCFDRDDRGASYYLGVTLILPFYVMLIVFTIELALILNAKIAVTHATYTTARAAAVWYSAGELSMEQRLGMIQLAAVNSLAPIASGSVSHQLTHSGSFSYPESAPTAWVEAFNASFARQFDADYMARKWKYAANATRIKVERSSPDFNSPLKVTLEFEHPFHTSGAGRLFGHIAPWLGASIRTITVRSTVIVENEGIRPAEGTVECHDQSLGIAFHANHGFRALNW